MKISAYFLLVLIVGMVFTPCADSLLPLSVQLNEVQNIEEDSHCNDNDCTPFCSCACCHTLVDEHIDLLVLLNTIGDHAFEGISQKRSFLRIHSIWDPPKS